ncbi:MAG: hypothetical protein SGILL_002477 [Bacillariaceae sp.]
MKRVCNTALSIADLSRDDRLDEDEYIRFLNRLSGNAYAGATFESLPGNIKENFSKFATDGEVFIFGAKPGQSADAAQDQFVDDFCCETDLAVSSPTAPSEPASGPPSPNPPSAGPPTSGVDCSDTVARNQCNTALSIADLSRDDLMDETEYVRFVNRLANNEYAGSTFDQMPGNIQQNFDKFAETNEQINIFGSKPGQSPSPEQDDFLDALCCETDLAVQNPGAGTPTVPPPSGGEPSVPGPAESFPPTFQDTICRTAMASSDFNRDDNLDETEYVRFLNRLTSNEFAGLSFVDLDETLQANFVSLAGTDGQIDIFGSKPGQTTNESQQANLEEICLDTAIALDSRGGSNPNPPSPAPVVAPQPGVTPTLPPTFAETTCYTAMATADFNRDDYLNQDEFVRFLNRLTSNDFEGLSFSDLPAELIATYSELSAGSENGIYIFGSKQGQTATENQEDFLEKVCLDVAIALNEGSGGAPVETPSGPTNPPGGDPTFAPGFSEIYNSFIISNAIGLTASDLESGAVRQGLDDAYGEFAVKAMNQLAAVVANARQDQQNLRRRKLVVALSPESDEIYLLLDSDCPEGTVARNTCQTAFAKFDVTITDEDPQEVSDEYTTATQVMISNGLLQTTLIEVDPSSLLSIVNASFPVMTTLPPTPSPNALTQPPSTLPPDDGGGNDKSLAGPIVGGLLGAILLCAAIGYVRVKGIPSMPSFGRDGGGKQTDDEDGFGQDDDDDDASEGGGGFGDGINGFGKDDDDDDEDDDDDDDDDDDMGQDQSRNVFGFGKKKKPDSDKQGFGLEEESENDASFNFDDPSEVASDKDANDGSVREDEEQVFGAGPASPGWGNSDDVFGNGNQGWGANGAEAENSAGENFFGNSAFDDEGQEGSQSGSGSYSSSEDDSTYQSDAVDGEENSEENSYDEEGEEGSFSRSSAEDGTSYNSGDSGSTPTSLESELRKKNEEMEAAIASGDWDAVAKAADDFGKQDSSIEGSSKRDSLEDGEEDEDDDSYSGSSRSGSASESGGSESSATTTTEQQQERQSYYAQVSALVALVLPDETDKVDAMMEQFKGREAELVSTLQTMQERTANQRARSAVHKSVKAKVNENARVNVNENGNSAGGTLIAQASLPLPAGFQEEFDAFAEEQQFPDEQSYYSDEQSGSEGPFSDEETSSRYTEEGSQSQSYTEGSGSYRSGSQYSDEGSQSYRSGEGSQSGASGSYRSGEESGSYRSGEESGSFSQSQSYRSGEGSHTGSQGSFDDQGSFEGSQYSGEEGSQYSGEEGSSYYSGDGDYSEGGSEGGSGSFGGGSEGGSGSFGEG